MHFGFVSMRVCRPFHLLDVDVDALSLTNTEWMNIYFRRWKNSLSPSVEYKSLQFFLPVQFLLLLLLSSLSFFCSALFLGHKRQKLFSRSELMNRTRKKPEKTLRPIRLFVCMFVASSNPKINLLEKSMKKQSMRFAYHSLAHISFSLFRSLARFASI